MACAFRSMDQPTNECCFTPGRTVTPLFTSSTQTLAEPTANGLDTGVNVGLLNEGVSSFDDFDPDDECPKVTGRADDWTPESVCIGAGTPPTGVGEEAVGAGGEAETIAPG